MAFSFYHPFYRNLTVQFPSGNITQKVYSQPSYSPVDEPWDLHAGSSNLILVELPPSLAVVSAGDWALGGTIVTAGLVVRILRPSAEGPPEVVYSATTTPRVLQYSKQVSPLSYTVTATSSPGNTPVDAYILSYTTKIVGDETVVSAYTFHVPATAANTFVDPILTVDYPVVTGPTGAIFDVRLDSDAFVDEARAQMLTGDTMVNLEAQVWGTTSQGDTYFSDRIELQAVLPVIREPSFL